MKKQTLQGYLDKNKGIYVKIHCVRGAGHIFIGSVADALIDLPKIDRELTDNWENKIASAKEYLETFDEVWQAKLDKLARILDENWRNEQIEKEKKKQARFRKAKEKKIELQKKLDNYESDKNKILKTMDKMKTLVPKRIKSWENKLEKYVPLLDRKVIESYPGIEQKNCKIVVIEGNLQGDYWFMEEYVKAKKKKIKKGKWKKDE